MKRWKGPGLIFISTLVTIILVLPTLVVVPFIGSNQEEQVQPVSTNEVATEQDINLAEGSSLDVSVLRSSSNQVDDVPLEVYVSRVVASEMPADFELEALKAQALAARTYIVRYLTNEKATLKGGAHVTDTIQHQVYKNDEELRTIWGTDYEWKMNKIEQAVAQTKGEVLTYKEEPIFAAFFSTSNGFTENSEDYWPNEFPYLRSVESPWDAESPKYMDQKVFTKAEIEAGLQVSVPADQPILSNVKKTESERVSEVTVGGKTFTGREIREALDLKSSDFTVKYKNDHIIFTTKGYGHGVGMSQYGANGMAQEGKTYEEILSHYYQGIAISKVDDFLPKIAAK
ncbi:stage II sporulation protein D [Pontibacillus yanchengensis]|uniref:Stage II sporulation protein D n=1 Tax=Pontibacillus yanchengensis Y32 TaxID=1385514 RepID=A0A0A2T8F3_9BACI|nr:stage II sporulation protein D [Pontibacillus yanchengensis]KGP71799.1 stage II sporulation protein D [Pontibacillus yanchengensis Y32]